MLTRLRERTDLPDVPSRWDDSIMSEKNGEKQTNGEPAQQPQPAPATQQMRTVGQRRRDAEEKLEDHLQKARHKDDPEPDESVPQEVETVDGSDVAAIQNDDELTAAERVDLIANQVVPKGGNSGEQRRLKPAPDPER
ncbi:hypothetical protein [Arthrobacter globiformis]|uniref:hypothetical protein n=1 Tax=Arthrobacter globiformis TaxID=1665 RepID=UPI00278B83EF|nr:hypothetical protein [Arthrobacter globiformis]MDQ0864961.1 hypothetical protein [Arthrobacter globiformis]